MTNKQRWLLLIAVLFVFVVLLALPKGKKEQDEQPENIQEAAALATLLTKKAWISAEKVQRSVKMSWLQLTMDILQEEYDVLNSDGMIIDDAIRSLSVLANPTLINFDPQDDWRTHTFSNPIIPVAYWYDNTADLTGKSIGIIGTKRDLSDIKYIVIHHTATRDDLSSSEMLLSMQRTYTTNRDMPVVPTHYIIDKEWGITKANDLDVIVWAINNSKDIEKTIDGNAHGVHIELVGNFNLDGNYPSLEQYKSIGRLVSWIREKAPNAQLIKWHSDFQDKNCPWKNFDFKKIPTYGGLRHASRYYSPVAWQKEYYNGRTLEEDVAMNCWWSDPAWCVHTASWHPLTDSDVWIAAACPPEMELGTQFTMTKWSKSYNMICLDRWGNIKEKRIDVRNWYGEQGIRNMRQQITIVWTWEMRF